MVNNDFAEKHSLRSSSSFESLLWKTINVLRNKATNKNAATIAEAIFAVAGVDFETAKTITIRTLIENNERAILLLDSLEQYPMSIQTVANAMSGLLKCVGQFNERNDRLKVRLCLPAELYHSFVGVSSNPLKDFGNSITLHWVARELLSIAAHRLEHYLRLYHHNKYNFNKNFSDRENLLAFFHIFLPKQITNDLGGAEDSIAYILRHTQLQPRHLLIFLNSVFVRQQKIDRSIFPLVSEEAVKSAVAGNEHFICEETFSGYQILYPNAKNVCEVCIPELPFTFDNAKLQSVFTRFGRKASGSDDYWDFRSLLIEMGIVGKIINETDRYYIGRFEYTEPNKLVVSVDDRLCLHPIFAAVFSYKRKERGKTVYPYGSDPIGADHRGWQD